MGKNKKGRLPLSVNWLAEDDQKLKSILQDEIRGLTHQIRNANTPSKKIKLRDRRAKDKALLRKIASGDYGSEQFFLSEQNRGVYVNPNPIIATTKAESAYDEIDFQYDQFFRKKRYYGFMLPFIMVILLAAFLVLPFLGNIIPGKDLNKLETSSIHLGALFTYRLDTEHDYLVKNDGLWPTGTWAKDSFLANGKKFVNTAGNSPDTVLLYKDLGMRTIDVTGLDVLKGFFYTELMAKTRIDFIENQPFMKGNSWYYVKFMMNKDLTVTKDAAGNYNVDAILRVASTHIIVYGFMFSILIAGVSLIFALLSMFGYTSRRIHILPLFLTIFSVLLFILPAFLMLDTIKLEDVFKQFFLFSDKSFMKKPTNQIMTGILPIINIGVSAVLLFVPLMFKNKTAKYQTFVPKGNKPPRKKHNSAEGN